MYDIINNVITSGRYELSNILTKIDTIWIQGDLTDEEHMELVEMAREKANPENSYEPLKNQVESLFRNLAELTATVTSLVKKVAILEGGSVEPEPEPEEWPEYVQPTGAHDAYKSGDKVTFEEKHYICKMDGCVWSPIVYPDAWELVEE